MLNGTAAELIGNTLAASDQDASDNQDNGPALSPAERAALESFGSGDVLDFLAYVRTHGLSARLAVRSLIAKGLVEEDTTSAIPGVFGKDHRFAFLTDAGRRAVEG